ncbi:MAG TPA: winged helix-turn-helix domain-containing protein [Candidatus Acidoferrum sp.]|nr:winged helix-turn-helix domain-containing protein [Candidatus Acidoferrum sp.]
MEIYRSREEIVIAILKELNLRPLRREELYMVLARKVSLPRSVFDRHLKFLVERKRIEKGPNKNDSYKLTKRGSKFLEALIDS